MKVNALIQLTGDTLDISNECTSFNGYNRKKGWWLTSMTKHVPVMNTNAAQLCIQQDTYFLVSGCPAVTMY